MTQTKLATLDSSGQVPASQLGNVGIAGTGAVRVYAGVPGSSTAPPAGTSNPYVFFVTDGAGNLADILIGNIL